MQKLIAAAVVTLGVLLALFVGWSEQRGGPFPLSLGLDLAGGTHLVYEADTSAIPEIEREASLTSLREVIERRSNLFGVAEPLVQIESSSFVAGEAQDRLIVELPGVTDLEEAIRIIGETPLLAFELATSTATTTGPAAFVETGLTGRFVDDAELVFGSHTGAGANEPIVLVNFNSEGATRFQEITAANVGTQLGIFLDGELISAPVIREAIGGGTAQISGGFTPEEARTLVRDLNFGALPVPIELLSTQSIGPALGKAILEDGVVAGIVGIGIVMLFMIVWYRLPGVIAAFALLFYVALMLAIIKLVPITLTAAGIGGLILSLGMAVDANVLIFERMREELAAGKGIREAARDGFARAWLPIRDGNISSLLAALILFWFGTSLIEGFALVFALGVLVSMLSAVMVTRALLIAIAPKEGRGVVRKLFGSGISL